MKNKTIKIFVLIGCVFLLSATNGCPPVDQVTIPQTGQTQCYDASGDVIDCTGTGQDGEYQEGMPWSHEGGILYALLVSVPYQTPPRKRSWQGPNR